MAARGAPRRDRGKSDRIDAIAVARAALREGSGCAAGRAARGPELDIAAARRSPRAADPPARRAQQRRCSGTCTTSGPSSCCRAARCFKEWGPRIARRLARAEQTTRVRIARDELRRIRELSHPSKRSRRDRPARRRGRAAAAHRARLRALDAGKLIGEIAGAGRFSTDAKLARAGGVAPIPVSSGNTNRHRLDRGGNRQINAAIHRIAVTRARCHPETKDYLARKRAEGKSTKEAIRCLKRHLARRIWHLLQPPHPDQGTPPSPSIS